MKKQSFKEFYGREAASEVQQGLLKENTLKDYKMFVYLKSKRFLWLLNKFPKNKIIRYLFLIHVNIISDYYFRKVVKSSNYQTILESIYNPINNCLKERNVDIKVNGVNDVSGWDWMNAEYTPWSFDQRISVNSGICYFSHVLCRSLQPYIIDKQENRNNYKTLSWWFNRQFRKSIVGIVTKNHFRALTGIFFIPEDESLLTGIESFVILHELGHAYVSQTCPLLWPYEVQPIANDIINADEEKFADIFAVHTLCYMYKKDESQKLLLFAPVFFFLINSWLEKEGLVSKPKSHPTSSVRMNYLKDEIQFLYPNVEYEQYSSILNEVWESNKRRIIKQVNKFNASYSKYEYMLNKIVESVRKSIDNIVD